LGYYNMAGRISYYGGIVKNGLVLDIDAAKKDSYPGSGTVWRDIAGSNSTGVLTNGPTFNSDNGGSIVFDGVDDYVNSISVFASYPSEVTIEHTFKVSSLLSNKNLVHCQYNPRLSVRSGNIINLYHTSYPNDVVFDFTGIILLETNKIYVLSVTYNSTNKYRCYVNGLESTNRTYTGVSSINAKPDFNSFQLGIGAGSEGYFIGNVYNTKMYNRALSSTEVLQNYNAVKGRFGL